MRLSINFFATHLNNFYSKSLFSIPRHIFRAKDSSFGSACSGCAVSTMSEPLMVGVCQMTSGSDVDKNIEVCKRLITKAKQLGAKMVFLPEAFDFVSENKEMCLSLAHSVDGPVIQDLSRTAKDEDVWLSLGGFHEKSSTEDSRVYNTHLILDNQGNVAGKYNKLHLFDVDIKGGVRLKESDSFIPGKKMPPVVKTPVGNVGLSICYDLRFPELSLTLAQQGADILTYPSAFTFITGAAHWECLLRARAVETQCYVIAAAQCGQHNVKRRSYGHAMVVDPWGQVIAQCHEGEDVSVTEIDLEYLNKVRTQMPVWEHRRYDMYDRVGPKL
ncbi:deaminated glutathione amidase-like [Dendronephthya gigantea]|uniref:deaminated glutathione amidase-like n=1 Tax=Dendronephthya gigantea TaxID=151771 RepID=UPI00106B7263|nr:deaminated glutathione amidase-like [Dendronephthya gigantea]